MKYVYFFIYGPLIEGGYDTSSIPDGSIFEKTIIINTKMYLTPYGYPVITMENGRSKGSLYKIPLDKIDELDKIEGYFKDESKNLTVRKALTLGGTTFYTYVASEKFKELVQKFDVEIINGDWLKFYNKHWKHFEDLSFENLEGLFGPNELLTICEDFGVDSIDEVDSLLESVFRFNIMLEAKGGKDKIAAKDDKKINELDVIDSEDPMDEPSLDDLTEPEPVAEKEPPVEPEVTPEPESEPEVEPEAPEPSLDDLTEPEPTAPSTPPPQPVEIPSSKKAPPSEKDQEPEVASTWKKEKHLRTLYNNFFRVYPNRGTKTDLNIKFTSVKADALHPESKYLQANVTSICESEKHKGKYYNQWMQLRRQRTTQQWSVDLPCEVRCNCQSFIYVMAYSNMKNKSLAGAVTRNGKLNGYKINYNIPSNETNPNYIPALCKHLMGLTNNIFDMNTGKVRKENII